MGEGGAAYGNRVGNGAQRSRDLELGRALGGFGGAGQGVRRGLQDDGTAKMNSLRREAAALRDSGHVTSVTWR